MALKDIITKLNEEFGKDLLTLGSDERFKIRRVSTGSYTLDYMTGGGLAIGRITEIYGNYSTGKTAMALKVMANMQKKFPKKSALYVNLENTFDENQAIKLGVDIGNLVIFRPEFGEELVNFVYKCLKRDVFSIIVIDSIAALLPQSEAEADAEKEQMGKAGKLTSALMRKLNSGNPNRCTIILLNQIRDKIGVMWGKKDTTPGGKAPSFFASQRIELKRGEAIKVGKGREAKTIGRVIYALLEKDKTSSNEQATGSYSYLFKQMRVDAEQELVDLAKSTGVIESKRGIMYVGQGYANPEAFKKALKGDQALSAQLWRDIRSGSGKKKEKKD